MSYEIGQILYVVHFWVADNRAPYLYTDAGLHLHDVEKITIQKLTVKSITQSPHRVDTYALTDSDGYDYFGYHNVGLKRDRFVKSMFKGGVATSAEVAFPKHTPVEYGLLTDVAARIHQLIEALEVGANSAPNDKRKLDSQYSVNRLRRVYEQAVMLLTSQYPEVTIVSGPTTRRNANNYPIFEASIVNV